MDNINQNQPDDSAQRRSAPPVPEIGDSESQPSSPQTPSNVSPVLTETTKQDSPAEVEYDLGQGFNNELTLDDEADSVLANEPKSFWQRLRHGLKSKKFIVSISLFIVLVVAVAVIPKTRYGLAGLVIQKDFRVLVIDSITSQPLSDASVMYSGKTSHTDPTGVVYVHVKPGPHQLTVSKKYYQTRTIKIDVPIYSSSKSTEKIELKATGRQVPVVVTNGITGLPIMGAEIRAADTKASTDSKGKAVIVLPTDRPTRSAKVSASGYNTAGVSLKVTGKDDAQNHIALTPAGSVYFLSKSSGTIDLVKTNLDGTAHQTVLAGTGNEVSDDTLLLPSQNQQYLVLKSKRDKQSPAKLYLIDTTNNDKQSVISSDNAVLTPVGWSSNYFIYSVYRAGEGTGMTGSSLLVSYDVSTGKNKVIDSTNSISEGSDIGQDYYVINGASVVGGKIVYAKNLYVKTAPKTPLNSPSGLFSINPDGSGLNKLSGYKPPQTSNYFLANILPDGMNALKIQISLAPNDFDNNAYYAYSDGKISALPESAKPDFNFFESEPKYFVSPDGKHTFWSEKQGSNYSLQLGDAIGKNGKSIGEPGPYQAYGWFTNSYLLLSQNSSQLFIMPVTGGKVLRISDYYSAQ